MDEEIAKRLSEIEDLVSSVALNIGDGGIDLLDLRNELEAVEDRLVLRIDEAVEGISRVAGIVESNSASLRARIEEIAEMVQNVHADLPTD